MVFGTFDTLHRGHLHFFGEAKHYGDYLMVVVARDQTVQAIKGKKARNHEKKRAALLRKVTFIDKVILGNTDDKHRVIQKYKPDVICLGYDQKAFTKGLKKKFPHIKIFRMRPYHPEKYKSSKLKNSYA